jgi:serine/threonine protein kinase
LSAVNYCHQRNIVHRDLKPENLLMNRDIKDPKITIIDFGTSGMFDTGE